MIKMASFLLSKVEPLRTEETVRLEQLNAQCNQVHQLDNQKYVKLNNLQTLLVISLMGSEDQRLFMVTYFSDSSHDSLHLPKILLTC